MSAIETAAAAAAEVAMLMEDDKISCSKTPDAYANLAKFTMGDVSVG